MIGSLTQRRTVVVAGNPNTGKSTLFNALTGGNVKVGNYPGITVERHVGTLRLPDLSTAELVDCPGTYSLSARSREEFLALEAVAGLPPIGRPDLVVVVVDATQITRNLYLTLQIIELGLPVVVALNMFDQLPAAGMTIDVETMARTLGVPVVPVVARDGTGIDGLKRQIAALLHAPQRARPKWCWQPTDARLRADIDAVSARVPDAWADGDLERRDAIALWALLSLDDDDELQDVPVALRTAVGERRAAADAAGRELEREIIQGRYAWIDSHEPAFLRQTRQVNRFSDRIDRVLLHPAAGFVLFLAIMTFLFQALFTLADPLIGWIEDAFALGQSGLRSVLAPGLFADFLVDGVLAGIGAFVVFLPQILILFLFLGIMEDSGYMARVAVLMDRVMRAMRLNGRAFVPLLSGYACAIPAILATRTMDRQRDRLLTMLVIPLMTCSARLPVYGLLIAAIVPGGDGAPLRQGLLMTAMYVFATLMALVVALVLGRTMLKGPRVPLVIEMPPYRLPQARVVLRSMWQQGREFMTKAGTIILACSIAMWLLLTFPRDVTLSRDYSAERATLESASIVAAGAAAEDIQERIAALDAEELGERTRASYAGRIGHRIEPALVPLGFDWRVGIGILGAFAAREVFVSSMGIVFGIGSDADPEDAVLRARLRAATWPDGRTLFTPLMCLSLMIFFALACQCMSTLAVIARETRGWRWPAFTFVYMTALAWLLSLAVYQGGHALGFG
ncbi:MAG: ferrous iron transport protein B [Planctomycetes bacterium]|nr:ferrous iron transport protein B [Planctomycetota bacterium]MCC7170527.1 ferrous iron transport protein B [Planctomycetota bacterium]